MESDRRDNSLLANWKCLLICCVVGIANAQYGFDTQAVAGFQAMPGFLRIYGYNDPKSKTGWNIHTEPQQLISSFLNVGTIVGVLLASPFAHYFGRKPAIWTASVVSLVASSVQIGSSNLGGLYAGRIILGLSNGFLILFSNTYSVEVAPARHRAILGSFFGFWVNLGAILGSVADNYTSHLASKLSYRIPLSCLFAIPVVLSLAIIFIPESPRWLLLHNRPDDALRSLTYLRGNSITPQLIREEFIEMQRGIEEEREAATTVSFLDMFRGVDLRRTMLSATAIVSHAASGVWFVISYATYFYATAGIAKPFLATEIQNCASFAGVLIGMFLMHKVLGRRPMVLIGTGVCCVCMLVIGLLSLAPKSSASGSALVAFAAIFSAGYNGFTGTITWPIAGEMSSSRLRVMSVGLGTGINYFFNWLIAYCSPFFLNSDDLNWGTKYGYIWAGANALAFAFFFFLLPETRGRTLEEIDEMFANKVPRRQFPTYHCVSSERARELADKEESSKTGVTAETVEHFES